MFESFNAPLAAMLASAGAIMAITFIGGSAIFLSGVLEVRAESPVEVAAQRPHAKGDRLPVFFKGTACSSLGWPHYEQACQFDMRRSADDVRIVRVLALR
jgi:hypothetical protein